MLLSSPCPSMQVSWAAARAAARAPWRVRGRGCCMGRETRLASSSSSFRPASETGRRHRRSEQRAAGGASWRRQQRGAVASQRPEAAGRERGGGREDTKTVSECGPRLQVRGRPAPDSVGPAGVERGRGLTGGAPSPSEKQPAARISLRRGPRGQSISVPHCCPAHPKVTNLRRPRPARAPPSSPIG